MKKIILSILFVISLPFIVLSQSQSTSVRGKVIDSSNREALFGATVLLNNNSFTTTDKKGEFIFKNQKGEKLFLKITYVGYVDTLVVFEPDFSKKENVVSVIKLEQSTVDLNQVIVEGKAVLRVQLGDTVQYNAAAIKLHDNATAKELVDALPGMTRDKDNKLHAEGKEVEMVKVDGRYMFQRDVDATLESLPADIVQNVQVFDDKSDLAKFTGFDDGMGSTTLNLVTKTKNLKFGTGRYEAGLGTDNRYEMNMNNTFFLGANRFSINGKLNNVNKGDFADIFNLGMKTGDKIYSDVKTVYNWQKEKTELSSDYSFLWKDRDATTETSQSFYNEDRTISSISRGKSFSRTHSGNGKLESKLGKSNKIYFIPSVSYSESTNKSSLNEEQIFNGMTISESATNSVNQSVNKKIGGELKWQSLLTNRFYLQAELEADREENDKDVSTTGLVNGESANGFDRWEDVTDWVDLKTKLIYMQTKNTGFTLSHQLGYKGEKSIQNNNPLELNYLKNRTTLGFMFRANNMHRYFFNIGYENTKDVNSGLNKNYQSIVGELSYTKLGPKGIVSIEFNRSAKTPNLYQVYHFIDASTPLQVRLGNPDLKQSYMNSLRVQLVKSELGRLDFNFTKGENYITQNTFISDGSEYKGETYANGTQITEYQNVNGYLNLSSSMMVYKGLPLGLSASLNYSYTNLPGMYNGVKNISKHNSLGVSLVKSIRNNKNYTYVFRNKLDQNWSNNSFTDRKNHYLSNELGVMFRYFNFKNFSFNFQYDHLYYYQPKEEEKHQHSNSLNIEIGRKLFKNKFELVLKMKNLLDQNQKRTKQFTNAYKQDQEKYGLGRYFMLSLKYKFSTVGKRGFDIIMPKEKRTF